MKTRSIFIAPLLAVATILIACSKTQTDGEVLMKFHAIQRIPGSQAVAIILTEENGQNFLPLYIDKDQALSIYLGHNEIASERPLSHDLMAEMLKSLEAKVERVVITDLRDNIYYAELELRKDTKTIKVDARPSDAIALALRVNAPIFAMQNLLEKTSDSGNAENALSQVRVKSWGLTVQSVHGTLQRIFEGRNGVLVTLYDIDSPAQQANLLPGDLIQNVDGEDIKDLEAFSKIMAEKSTKTSIDMEIFRDHKSQHIMLTKHN